jgi:O-antigen/teichoic acid export membrane protein
VFAVLPLVRVERDPSIESAVITVRLVMGRNRELLINSISIGIGTIASRIITFLLVPLYSNWLTPAEYGIFDVVATYITLLVPFATLQLEQALFRYCVEKPQDSGKYYSCVVSIVLPVLSIVTVAVIVIMSVITDGSYTSGFIFYFVSFALFNINAEFLRGTKRLKAYSAANVSFATLLMILAIIFVGKLHCGINGMLACYGASYLTVAVAISIVFHRFQFDHHDRGDRKLRKTLLAFSVPLIPNTVSWWISNVSNRTFINIFMGNSANGLFAVASKIPTIVSLLFGIFNQAFQQTAITSLRDVDRKAYFSKLLVQLIRILGTGCALITVCTPLFYHLFIERSYWEGMYCVPFLVAGAMFLCIAQYLGDVLLAMKKTVSIGSSTIWSGILTIVFNFILVPTIGLLGASLATALAYIIMLLLRARKLSNEFEWNIIIPAFVQWTGIFVGETIVGYLSMENLYPYLLVIALATIGTIFFNKMLIVSVFEKLKH